MSEDTIEVEFPIEGEPLPPEPQAAPSGWRNRIIGSGMMPPEEFLASPHNFRIHSSAQEAALEEVLNRVGWVRTVLVNQTTGHVIDGHLRVALGIRRGEAQIPYDLVELTEAEEKLVLAALDPIAGMAGTDHEQLAALMADLELDLGGSLHAMLTELEEASRPKGHEEGGHGAAGQLAERFGVPPFSVLNAREGWWQDRKAAWISLGIRSEIGRGGTAATSSHPPTVTRNTDGTFNYGGVPGQAERFDPQRTKKKPDAKPGNALRAREDMAIAAQKRKRKANATPGGSTMPAANYGKTKARGAGRGRPLPGTGNGDAA